MSSTKGYDSLGRDQKEKSFRGKRGKAKRARRESQDLAKYEMVSGEPNIIYQIANQSGVDYRMLLRKAGYTGAVYREQYEGKNPAFCPVVELVLYWGEKRWNASGDLRRLFRRKKVPEKAWEYIDDLKLHVWEMRHLPPEVRERFQSDMRIVVDYLAEGNGYTSDRRVVHKEALVKMLRVLSGDKNVEDTAAILQELNIKEEDEIKMCELFDQYTRKGIEQGIEQERIVSIRNLMSKLKMTIEQAMETLDIPEKEQLKYMVMIKQN